jgi:hypothetical protein
MIGDGQLIGWVVSIATAALSAFAPQSHKIYDAACVELDDKGGPLGRMKGLMSGIMDRVGKCMTQAVQQMARPEAEGGEDEFSIDEAVGKILEGSTEDLANFVHVRELRNRRREATRVVRDRARFLQLYSLAAILMAAVTLASWYASGKPWAFALPGTFLLGPKPA